MTHYVPIRTADGWAVAYENHRGELIAVMECATFAVAYRESADMSRHALVQQLQLQQLTQVTTRTPA